MLTYFGPPWDAPIMESAAQVPIPLGEQCLYCPDPILDGEQGVMLPYVDVEEDGAPRGGLRAVHRECFLRATVGTVAHLKGECSCKQPGSDDPQLSWREEGRAVIEWLEWLECRRS